MAASDNAQILAKAWRVVEEAMVGVMSTVDEQGQPHCRYMAAVMDEEGLGRLFCLTGTLTEKVRHIRKNPRVGWLFTQEDYNRVVALTGRAELMNTSDLRQSVWDHLIDYAEPYAITPRVRDQTHSSFTAIVTEVDSISYLCPDEDIPRPKVIAI